jgi:putative endonuclease
VREHDRVSAFVYLLRCADGSLYCGWTTDPARRLRQHQAGTASRYTKRRRPVAYALVLSVPDRSAALREEWRIKQLARSEKLALIGAAGQPTETGPSAVAVSRWRARSAGTTTRNALTANASSKANTSAAATR